VVVRQRDDLLVHIDTKLLMSLYEDTFTQQYPSLMFVFQKETISVAVWQLNSCGLLRVATGHCEVLSQEDDIRNT
jgi:hypothetical protein